MDGLELHRPSRGNVLSGWLSRWPRVRMRRAYDVLLLLALFVLVGYFAVRSGLESARRTGAIHNMKIILMGLHNYYEAYGCLPPRVIRDARGRDLYSWRVVLLPFVGYEDLYRAYDLREPWDSVHNRDLAKWVPSVYRSPRAEGPPHAASYVAVVNREGPWAEKGCSSFPSDPDVVLLIEFPGWSAPWSAPCDPDIEEVISFLTSRAGKAGSLDILLGSCYGFVHWIRRLPAEHMLRQLFSREGGNAVRAIER